MGMNLKRNIASAFRFLCRVELAMTRFFFLVCFFVRRGKHCSISTSPKNEMWNYHTHSAYHLLITILHKQLPKRSLHVYYWCCYFVLSSECSFFDHSTLTDFSFTLFQLLVRIFIFSGYCLISPHLLSVIHLG